MKKTAFVLCCTVNLLTASIAIAQEDELDVFVYDASEEPIGDITPRHTLNLSFGLPTPMTNRAFKDMLKGVVEISPYYQYFLPNSFVLGIGLHYAHYTINQFRTPENLSGGVNTFGAFVKIGYEKFFVSRFAMDFSVKIGNMNKSINTDLNDKNNKGTYQKSYAYASPIIGFILTASEHSSYRLSFSYDFQGTTFNPTQLGSDKTSNHSASQLAKKTQVLTVSMGYTHYF